MVKKYLSYINENLNMFNEVKEGKYIRVFRDNEFLGFFKVLNKIEEKSQMIPNEINFVLTVQKHEILTAKPTDTTFVINSLDKSYTFDIVSESVSAGILCVYEDEILLIRPIKKHGDKPYTYPKGKQNPGEDIKDTAIREFTEEVGIEIPKELLDDKYLFTFQYFRDEYDNQYYHKTQYFWAINLTKEQYKRYFNTKSIPKENLQEAEIEWGGFLNKEKASEVIRPEYEHILRFI